MWLTIFVYNLYNYVYLNRSQHVETIEYDIKNKLKLNHHLCFMSINNWGKIQFTTSLKL